MQEVAPDLWDWATFHEGIGEDVHSHLVVGSGTLIDPRLPDGGVEEIAAIVRPSRVVLTNRHHLRHAHSFVEAFGCSVRCHEAGMHEFGAGTRVTVEPFSFGDALADDVRAVEVGALTPEETGLLISVGDGWLALADIVIRAADGGSLGYVPDELLGDDPDAVRAAMTAALRRLLDEHDFTGLVLAHGAPMPDGRAALEAFVQ